MDLVILEIWCQWMDESKRYGWFRVVQPENECWGKSGEKSRLLVEGPQLGSAPIVFNILCEASSTVKNYSQVPQPNEAGNLTSWKHTFAYTISDHKQDNTKQKQTIFWSHAATYWLVCSLASNSGSLILVYKYTMAFRSSDKFWSNVIVSDGRINV